MEDLFEKFDNITFDNKHTLTNVNMCLLSDILFDNKHTLTPVNENNSSSNNEHLDSIELNNVTITGVEQCEMQYIQDMNNICNQFCNDVDKLNNVYKSKININTEKYYQLIDIGKKIANETINKQKIKKYKTLYWAVEIENFVNDEINEFIKDKSKLIPLYKIHTLLLFVGKKDNEKENIFFEHNKKKCSVLISEFSCSTDALCIKVDNILFKDNTKVPIFIKVPHITFALREGIDAKYSINAFTDGITIQLKKPVKITGRIKQFF